MLVRLRCRFEMMSTSRFYFSFRHEKQHSAAEVVEMLFFFFMPTAIFIGQVLLTCPLLVEKVNFYKIEEQILYPFKNALRALRPCKAFGRSISASLPKPQTPSPWEGVILLELPPLVPAGGLAPKQGCFGCLPKVLHDAKPTEQAISDTPFNIYKRFFDSLWASLVDLPFDFEILRKSKAYFRFSQLQQITRDERVKLINRIRCIAHTNYTPIAPFK